jgi:hypothetical protein
LPFDNVGVVPVLNSFSVHKFLVGLSLDCTGLPFSVQSLPLPVVEFAKIRRL